MLPPMQGSRVRHDEARGDEVGVRDEQIAHGLPSSEVGEEVDK
jgi:hypothetical protein